MRCFRRLADERGAASVEMALLVPLLLVLLFGGFEAGHFVWTQHKLAEAVRDGARFASRLSINDLCDGATSTMTSETETEIKLITRTGQLDDADANPRVPGWTADQVTVTQVCNADEFVSTGVYRDLGSDDAGNPLKGPIVRVSAVNVTYPSLFDGLGIIDSTVRLSATSNAPVTGL